MYDQEILHGIQHIITLDKIVGISVLVQPPSVLIDQIRITLITETTHRDPLPHRIHLHSQSKMRDLHTVRKSDGL